MGHSPVSRLQPKGTGRCKTSTFCEEYSKGLPKNPPGHWKEVSRAGVKLRLLSRAQASQSNLAVKTQASGLVLLIFFFGLGWDVQILPSQNKFRQSSYIFLHRLGFWRRVPDAFVTFTSLN